jgi:dihydroneopterin aldolase
MLTVSLNSMRFHTFHGMYPEEKVTGNEFEVTLQVKYEGEKRIDDISQTINYVDLFEMVNKRMQVPTPLLETVAMDIASAIREKFPVVHEINITINKLSLPIANFQGNVSVSYSRKYD